MLIKSLIAVALLATSVAAQGSLLNSTIDPNAVDPTTRSQWCNAQINTCGTLCSGDTSDNSCDDIGLTYNCTCAANNSAPGLQFYTNTLPTFICEYNYDKCINESVSVLASQKKCQSDEEANCGHTNSSAFVAVVSSSSSSSATATPTSSGASGASTPTASSTSTSKAAAATLMAIGGEYGAGVVAAGIAAAFGMML